MLSRTYFFLIFAVLAGILGFGEFLGEASSGAKIIFILLLAFSTISYLLGKRPPIT